MPRPTNDRQETEKTIKQRSSRLVLLKGPTQAEWLPDASVRTLYDLHELLDANEWHYVFDSSGPKGIIRFVKNEMPFGGQYRLELTKRGLWTCTSDGYYHLEKEEGQMILDITPIGFNIPEALEAWERELVHGDGIVLDQPSSYAVFPQYYPENLRMTIRLWTTPLAGGGMTST